MFNRLFIKHALPYPVQLGLIVFAYWATGQLGFRYSIAQDNVTLVWPPSGIALAAILILGYRAWPAVALGAFLVNFQTGLPLPAILLIALGNTLEPIIGTYLLKNCARFQPHFAQVSDVLAFVLYGAIVSPLIAGTLGAAALHLSQFVPANMLANVWLEWLMGDGVGILIITPAILVWLNPKGAGIKLAQPKEAIFLTISTCIIAWLVFGWRTSTNDIYPLTYPIFPFMIWAALRLDLRWVTSLSVLISILAVANIPIQSENVTSQMISDSLFYIWSYLSVFSITALILAVIVQNREIIERNLARERDFISQIVNAMGHGVAVTDDQGRFTYVNPAYAQMVGIQPANLIGQAQQNVLDVEGINSLSQPFKINPDRTTISYEAHFQRPDSTEIHAIITNSPYYRDNQLAGSIIAMTEMTERKKMEKALRQGEAFMRTVINNLPMDIWMMDADGRYQMQGPVLKSHWGDLIGKRIEDLSLPPQNYEKWKQQNERVMSGETLKGEVQYTIDGELRDFYYITSPVYDGERIVGILGANIDITERKRAEEKLREREALLQTVINNLPLDLWVNDIDNRCILQSPASVEIWGDILGKTYDELNFPAEMKERWKQNDIRLLKDMTRRGEEEYIINGEKHVFYSINSLIQSGEDTIGILGINLDITDRKRTEEKLREREILLQTVINNLPLDLWVNDANNRCIIQSPTSIKLWGNIVGKSYDELNLTPQVRERWENNNLRVLNEGTQFGESEFIIDGKKHYFYYINSAIRSGDAVLGLLGINVDITERKMAEARLADSEARFRAIFDSATIGISILDERGHTISVNPAIEQMMGYDSTELAQMRVSAYTHPDDREETINNFRKLIAGEIDQYRMQKRYIHKNGNTLWGRTIVYRLPTPGAPLAIAMIEDITEQKHTEIMLRQSEKSTLDFLEHLKALQNITIELASESTLDDLYSKAVELGHTRLGFDRIGIWLLEENGDYMLGTFGIDEYGQLRDERGQQLPVAENTMPNETHVMESNGQGIFFREDTNLFNDASEVVGRGWLAMGYLNDGQRIFGTLSVDNLISGKPAERYQLELLNLYSNALSYLIIRKQTEEALRNSEESSRSFLEKLKSLQQITITLARATTFDEFCRQAIELGRSQLKFDRLGLWFTDKDPDYLVGSYGIDEQGNLRNERGKRIPMNNQALPISSEMIHLSDQTIYFNENADLLDDENRIVGHGWSAVGYLNDGGSIIGQISSDNLLSQDPPKRYQLELLALYSNVLGYLASRKQTEIELKQSEARFRSIFNNAGVGIILTDRNQVPISANPTMEHLVGYSAEELRQMTFTDFTYPDDKDHNILLFSELLAHQRDTYRLEKRYIRKDGQIVWARLNVSRFPEGEQPVIITIVEDITERKLAEAALQQLTADLEHRIAERTAELKAANERLTELDLLKTKFIADVTHELRTPLAVLSTRVYLLQHSPPEKHPEYLAALKEQLERLAKFVNTVLDLSRLELGKDKIEFGEVDLNQVITQVVAALAPRAEIAGLTLELYQQKPLPYIEGEFNQLAQVITNLVANAINYTSNGSITVSTWQDESRARICLEVKDTGMGIPQEEIPHLFTRFYRGQRAGQSTIPGTGLGLSIVKEIVDLHEGEIEVLSRVGVGTTFRVWLPYHKPS